MYELEKSKRSLEALVEDQRQQIMELEDQLDVTEKARQGLEVINSGLEKKYKSELAGREDQEEEKRRSLLRAVSLSVLLSVECLEKQKMVV